jgi:hypothetical protein
MAETVKLVAIENIIPRDGAVLAPGTEFETDAASAAGHLANGTAAKPGSKEAKAASDDS